jgi:hypothetical protein
MLHHGLWTVLFAAGVCALSACRGETKPRSLAEIDAERMSLPALYITTSGKHVTARGDLGVFVDQQSREIAWPAYTCENPQCPGRKQTGEPLLFTWQDPRFYVTPDGTLGTRDFATLNEWREAVQQAGGFREPTCPECFKSRNPQSETPEERETYSNFVRRYDSPETIARRKQLDEERETRRAFIERRTQSP